MTRRDSTDGERRTARLPALVFVILLVTVGVWLHGPPDRDGTAVRSGPAAATPAAPSQDGDLPDFLPREAHTTLALIARGGPFPHPQDGGVFGNREGHLPQRERGYYREYTVGTEGLGHRGARRIVTGGNPPRFYYYTDDHYDSFRGFELNQ